MCTRPSVVQEEIKAIRREEAQTVVDREVHQDHYHTTVQPIKAKEVLPEQHQHRLASTDVKEYHHGDQTAIKERLAAEAAQFKSTTVQAGTEVTQSVAPTIGGEHVHHHVHETIQPVVQKEVIQPSVVHTTVPVHEIHHKEAKHHATSALTPVSWSEFKAQGGTLSGREERVDHFDGEPRTESSTVHTRHAGPHLHGTDRPAETVSTSSSTYSSNNGPHGTIGNKLDPRVDSDGSRNTTGTGTYGHQDTTTHKKPGLLDRLNPLKDTDGDGKKGIME
jgi:hypothetical protein